MLTMADPVTTPNGTPLPKKKSWLRRRWKIIVVVLVITLVALGWVFSRNGNAPEIVTEQVRRGTLEQTVEASGVLESIEEVDLAFETSGTVDKIFFDVGDSVEEGDLIARLKNDELNAGVSRASQAVASAQARLNLEQAGAPSADIAVSFASFASAQASLAAAQTELENVQKNSAQNVASALNALETAQDNLSSSSDTNDLEEQNAKENLISEMKSNLVSIRSALSDTDEILGVNNTLANDDYEDILSHGNKPLLTTAQREYEEALDTRDDAEIAVFALNADSTSEEVLSAAGLVGPAFIDTSAILLLTRQALDATSIETSSFTSADLSALKSRIDATRNEVQLEEAGFVTKKSTYNNELLDTGIDKTSLQNALEAAEQSYNTAIITRDTSIATAQATVSIREFDVDRAEAALAQVEADPRFVDIAGLIADVRAAEADLAAAQARAAKAEVRAPISGELTDLVADEGEQILAGAIMATVQTTDEAFRVFADIAESDISKIALRDSVELTFDAFGDDVSFVGSVSFVNPAAKLVEGVTFYEIEIDLGEEIFGLKPGMSADATVETETLSDALIVPQRSVLERDGQTYVRIPKTVGQFEDRNVEIGLRGDGGLVEILSGVEEGEEVITSIRE